MTTIINQSTRQAPAFPNSCVRCGETTDHRLTVRSNVAVNLLFMQFGRAYVVESPTCPSGLSELRNSESLVADNTDYSAFVGIWRPTRPSCNEHLGTFRGRGKLCGSAWLITG